MLAAGALLMLGGFVLAGRLAVFLTWAAILGETLRTREVVFFRRWGVRHTVKPVPYWAIVALMVLATAACLYWLLEGLKSPAP